MYQDKYVNNVKYTCMVHCVPYVTVKLTNSHVDFHIVAIVKLHKCQIVNMVCKQRQHCYTCRHHQQTAMGANQSGN